MSHAPSDPPPEPAFRAKKKRKVFRTRDGAAEPHNASLDQGQPSGASKTDARYEKDSGVILPPFRNWTEELQIHDDASVADLLRTRKSTKSRRGGIGFGQTPKTGSKEIDLEDGSKTALVAVEQQANVLETVKARFAPQIGAVAETSNEHMTAYVEAELARLRSRDQANNDNEKAQTSTSGPQPSDGSISKAHEQTQSDPKTVSRPTWLPTSLGQIQEIDLGPHSTARNVALTSAATQRLSDQTSNATPDEPSRPGRVRVGRDGKPLPPRKSRKRRGSADLARDAAVEAILRENTLGLYDSATPSSPQVGASANSTVQKLYAPENTTADDIIAQQFEREYLEAAQERENLRKPPPPPGPPPRPGEKVSEIAKGPKLGGSRSARAAMHAREKERERERKGLKGN